MREWSEEHWLRLRQVARFAWHLEERRIGMGHWMQNYQPAAEVIASVTGREIVNGYALAIDAFSSMEKEAKRAVARAMRGHPVEAFVNDTKGLGLPGVGLLIGNLPRDLHEFRTPGGVKKSCGLDVQDGRAPRRRKGQLAGFVPRLRAIALYRIGDPMLKSRGDFRAVYDDRKEYTLESHPPGPVDDCRHCRRSVERTRTHRARRGYERERKAPAFDCSNVGGTHWSDGHRHADALRVMTKAILVDLWYVAKRSSAGQRNVACAAEVHEEPEVAA